jgi:hypothetical protein
MIPEHFGRRLGERPLPGVNLVRLHAARAASFGTVASPRSAASATLALKAGSCLRRIADSLSRRRGLPQTGLEYHVSKPSDAGASPDLADVKVDAGFNQSLAQGGIRQGLSGWLPPKATTRWDDCLAVRSFRGLMPRLPRHRSQISFDSLSTAHPTALVSAAKRPSSAYLPGSRRPIPPVRIKPSQQSLQEINNPREHPVSRLSVP